MPERVTIVEVAPRDGLQAEAQVVSAEDKVAFIERLAAAGHRVIEATSFVSPEAVPQLADAEKVAARLPRRPGLRHVAFVPNERGLERALAAGMTDVAFFASATETYSVKNVGRTRAEVLDALASLVARARGSGLRVRAYLAMALGDPWEGPAPAGATLAQAERLLELGIDELAIGDTLGSGTPRQVQELIGAILDTGARADRLAVHFHDTYGQALANVLVALELGVTTIDASAGGIGGSPFAKAAAGNLATEDLVWMLDGLGVETGVDAVKVAEAATWMCGLLGREPPGRATRALAGRSAG
ncbi:MAG: hydroxymethylglutaryl-CoA lyase [Candidatus Limnocylindria bacterium]